MIYKHIEVETRDNVAIIRLNRPRYRNAQSRLLLEEMTDAFATLDLDSSVKVIVLAGAGDHFSAGHDLGTPEEAADRGVVQWGPGVLGRINRSWHLYIELSLRWRDVKKPTIAMVQGYCIFGGFLIASCMDVIIAADDALFLPSHLQLHTAPWDLGIRNAKKILFENRFIPAEEAQRLGLVSEVVPREQLEEATMAQAARWAANDLLTLRMVKQSVNSAQDMMGYRNHLHAAHSNYMIMEMAIPPEQARANLARRQNAPVAAALAKVGRAKSKPG
jgi:enoyl-CoA hydratase